jgi:replicative DNA helicase
MIERSGIEKAKVINLFEEISIFKEILTDNSKVSRLIGFFFKDKVSTRRHELLRGAMAFLYGINKPIDVASLVKYFSEKELLEAVGGCQYLRYIAEYNLRGH